MSKPRASSQPIEKVKNFKEIFNNGKKLKTFSSQLIVLVEKNPQATNKINLGVLALKKIVGKKAVHRNRAKRRYRHGMLAALKLLPLQTGCDIKLVALTNKNTLSCPWSQIIGDIEKELRFVNEEIKRLHPQHFS